MSNCPICYDEINEKTGMTTLGCSHSYHLRCIVKWINTHDSCPCCRTELNENEKIRDIYANNQEDDESTIAELLMHLSEIEIYGEDEYEHFDIVNEIPVLQLPPNIIRYYLDPTAPPFVPDESIH